MIITTPLFDTKAYCDWVALHGDDKEVVDWIMSHSGKGHYDAYRVLVMKQELLIESTQRKLGGEYDS